MLFRSFSELWVDDIKIGVGVGNSNKIETTNQDLVLDAGTNQTLIDSNLRVAGVATVTGNLTLGSGIEPSTDNTVTLGTASKRFSSSQIAAIRIGVGATNKIDTVSGTSLTLDSSAGTTTVDDKLVVTGIGTFNSEVQFDIGVKPDTSKGAYIGTTGTPFSQAFINEIQIGVAQTNKIDTREGSLRLDGANGLVAVDNNLTVGGASTLSGALTVGSAADFTVNTSSNRVGVGTNVLTRKFQVKDTINLITEFRTDSTDVTIGLGRSAVGAGQSVGKVFYSTRTLSFDNEDLGGLEFVTNSGTSGLNTGSFRWRWGQNNAISLLDLTYDGKLGLGITNPTQTLHVVGTSTVTGNAFFGNNVTISGTLNAPNIVLPNPYTGNISTTTGISTVNNLTAIGNITVSSGSSIGIGTTVPIVHLDVRGRTGLFGFLGVGTNRLYTDETLSIQGTALITDGSVGIGTTAMFTTSGSGGVQIFGKGIDLYNSSINVKTDGKIGFNTSFARAIFDYGNVGSATTRPVMVVPNINNSTRNGIGQTPTGSMIFNTDTSKFQGYTGVAWTDFH